MVNTWVLVPLFPHLLGVWNVWKKGQHELQGLTGHLLIDHSGTSHWFTKDIWLGGFSPALGPGKQLFFQMKAVSAVGTSLPPDLLWATSWAPAPASLCSGLQDQSPRLTHSAAGGTAQTEALAQYPCVLSGLRTFRLCLASSQFCFISLSILALAPLINKTLNHGFLSSLYVNKCLLNSEAMSGTVLGRRHWRFSCDWHRPSLQNAPSVRCSHQNQDQTPAFLQASGPLPS